MRGAYNYLHLSLVCGAAGEMYPINDVFPRFTAKERNQEPTILSMWDWSKSSAQNKTERITIILTETHYQTHMNFSLALICENLLCLMAWCLKYGCIFFIHIWYNIPLETGKNQSCWYSLKEMFSVLTGNMCRNPSYRDHRSTKVN